MTTTTTTIALKYPITLDGNEVREVSLRRPLVGDILKLDAVKSDTKRELTLISVLSGLPSSALEMIDMGDWGKIQKVAVDFLS